MQYPFERITLPSLGQGYKNSLSVGTVNLYPLTAKHEDILCSPGLYRDYLHFDTILKDIIVNDDVDIDDILQVDVEGIMLASKMLSFGPKQQSSITCPHCSEKDNYIINLANFKPVEATVPTDKIYEYKGYQIHFNIPTYGLFKQSTNSADLLKKSVSVIFDSNMNIIGTDKFFTNVFLYKDYQKFRKYLKSVVPCITPEIGIPCKMCDKIIKIPFKFDRNFFGMDGTYKVRLHSEILALIYSSNGGFTHSDIYNMPISLRMVYIKELMDIKNKEQEQIKKSQNGPSSHAISRPDIPK